ncbi:MAG: type II/IV secretion system protein, partial [Candidatus Sumerlaeota bacterium]
IAQRLIRKVCKECFKRFQPKPELLKTLGLEEDLKKRLPRAVGCSACLQTGYQGRTGIYELMPMSNELAEAVLAEMSESEMAELSHSNGNLSMREVASKKMLDSVTTAEEVLAVVGTDED